MIMRGLIVISNTTIGVGFYPQLQQSYTRLDARQTTMNETEEKRKNKQTDKQTNKQVDSWRSAVACVAKVMCGEREAHPL
jgi:hypothetical protein